MRNVSHPSLCQDYEISFILDPAAFLPVLGTFHNPVTGAQSRISYAALIVTITVTIETSQKKTSRRFQLFQRLSWVLTPVENEDGARFNTVDERCQQRTSFMFHVLRG
jgi:hypothetical protein